MAGPGWKVKDGLFVGDKDSSSDWQAATGAKVTHVINCCGQQLLNRWQRDGVVYLTYKWIDGGNQVILDEADSVANEVFEFVEKALEDGGSVLIHSYHGQSRSVCILCAYLMRKYRWSMTKTIEYLQFKQVDVDMKPPFKRQLLGFERRLVASVGALGSGGLWDEDGVEAGKVAAVGAETTASDFKTEAALLTNTVINGRTREASLITADLPLSGRSAGSKRSGDQPERKRRVSWPDLPLEGTTEHPLATFIDAAGTAQIDEDLHTSAARSKHPPAPMEDALSLLMGKSASSSAKARASDDGVTGSIHSGVSTAANASPAALQASSSASVPKAAPVTSGRVDETPQLQPPHHAIAPSPHDRIAVRTSKGIVHITPNEIVPRRLGLKVESGTMIVEYVVPERGLRAHHAITLRRADGSFVEELEDSRSGSTEERPRISPRLGRLSARATSAASNAAAAARVKASHGSWLAGISDNQLARMIGRLRAEATISSDGGMGSPDSGSTGMAADAEVRVLMLGLDRAGKTTIMRSIFTEGGSPIYQPTQGVNMKTRSTASPPTKLVMTEVGGQSSTRQHWGHFAAKTDAFIYVVDARDESRFGESFEALSAVLKNGVLAAAPLLVLANGIAKAPYVSHSVLQEIKDHVDDCAARRQKWHVQPCCALTGDGLQEGLKWFEQQSFVLGRALNPRQNDNIFSNSKPRRSIEFVPLP